jgi:hypothetical protein
VRAYARASVLSDALEQIASTIHGQSPRALLRSREEVLRVTEVSESVVSWRCCARGPPALSTTTALQ